MTFEEMLESFLGREIDGIEFTNEDELMLYLNDDAIMVIGAEEASWQDKAYLSLFF